MTRGVLDANLLAALNSAHVSSFVLIEMDFDSGMLYLTTAPHDVDWNSNTYTAMQGVGSIAPTVETDAGAQGLTFTLSGVPQSAIAGALTEDVQGRAVVIRLAVIDGTTLRVDPNVWSGSLDVMSIADGTDSAVIQVTAEHALIAWQQPSGALFSDAEQQLRHPGDKFFEFAAQMAEATLVWPDKSFFKQ